MEREDGDELRMEFIVAEKDHPNFTELCELIGISRQTEYKWLRRFDEEGIEGMGERSRAPARQ